MKITPYYTCVAILMLASNSVFAQSLETPEVGAAPGSEIRNQPEDRGIDRNLTRPPEIALPAQIPSDRAQTHVGRVWVTPVLLQQQNGGGVTTSTGASRGRRIAEAQDGPIRTDIIQETLQNDEAEASPDTEDVTDDRNSGGAGVQTVTNYPQLRLDQLQAAQQEAARDEAEEVRMCKRSPRGAWESFTSFFGATHLEECRTSVRRRETHRVAAATSIKVTNALYFINLSTTNETDVQVVCRMRESGEITTVNISVAPLDFGQWSPPCACDNDYKFWCTVSSREPIAAHAVQSHKSATQESLEYVDFFLIE